MRAHDVAEKALKDMRPTLLLFLRKLECVEASFSSCGDLCTCKLSTLDNNFIRPHEKISSVVSTATQTIDRNRGQIRRMTKEVLDTEVGGSSCQETLHSKKTTQKTQFFGKGKMTWIS